MKHCPLGYRQARAFLTLVFAAVIPLAAADFTVNVTGDLADAVPGDGFCRAAIGFKQCSLRAAIQETNALAGPDTINLPGGRYVLSIAGTDEDNAASGDLDVLDDLLISGQGIAETIIDGNDIDRVFHVHAGVSPLELDKLTVTGGAALDNSTATSGLGGGVLAESSTLIVYWSQIAGNKAITGGGVAGWSAFLVKIEESEITGNEIQEASGLTSLAGGVYFKHPSAGFLEILDSTIAGNGCLARPAAECVGGVVVDTSGFSNGSDYGLTMLNSTVSGNEGVGLALGESDGVIVHSTIYGNSGYGLVVDDDGQQLHAVAAENTILANNGIQDCLLLTGNWSLSGGHNLSSDATCALVEAAGDQIDEDPELYPLGYYTPPSPRIARSHHPRWGSPVIEAGLDAGVDADQDGYSRPVFGLGGLGIPIAADIGSIEVRSCSSAPVDRVFADETVPSDTYEACNTITAMPNVVINGAVTFLARDSVTIGNGFEVTAGSTFSVAITRTAGVFSGT